MEFGVYGTGTYRHFALNSLGVPRTLKAEGHVLVLTTDGSDGYYHWLLDALPRLEIAGNLLEKCTQIVIPSGLPIIRESLSLLGFGNDRLIQADEEFNLVAETLIVPSLPGRTGRPGRWEINFLRGCFLGMDQVADKASESRIYISRSHATKRRVTNEDELIDFLVQRGFKILHLEDMSFREQIHVFANADVVVAPHGAGLTNLVWCNVGTRVLEFFSPNYVNVCFWCIAAARSMRYHYMIGEGDRPQKGHDPHRAHEDICVCMKKFAQTYEKMMQY
jgi:capsular polysaccharide biosynthesis protein